MVDINHWRMQHPSIGAPLDFGLASLDYPLETQVDIGDIDSDYQDASHPNVDGEVFGIDRLRGFPITFNCRILDDGLGATKWDQPLDLYSAFASKWRADNIRRRPGIYATLINLERNRLVYGRPRQIAPRHTMLRKGVLDFVAQFRSNGPNWYSLTEKNVTLSLVSGSTFGFNSPITSPITTVGEQVDDLDIDNDGDLETWPIIELHGPGSGWNVALRQGGETIWAVDVEDKIRYDEVLLIDTRPWARKATINDRPANGLLRGSSITEMQIPVGNFKFRLRVKDGTGTAFAKVYWRDAYAAL